jgi:hypothetical protein
MAEYTIIIERAEGNYSAYCPDLPGCIATKEGEIAIPEPSTKAVSIEVTA